MASESVGLRVLIAGGGTGGHVIPALAIGQELRDRAGAEVRFVGTARGLETRLVPEAGFPLELIRVGQLKNVSLMTRVRTLADFRWVCCDVWVCCEDLAECGCGSGWVCLGAGDDRGCADAGADAGL